MTDYERGYYQGKADAMKTQEPVAWAGVDFAIDCAPPQRKPLTHPQIHELDWPDGVSFEDILLFARAIEAAHGIKEKNK